MSKLNVVKVDTAEMNKFEIIFNAPDMPITDISEEALSEIELAAKTLPDPKTTHGLKEIKARRATTVKVRTGGNRYREELKAPALNWCETVERAFRDNVEPRLKAVEAIYKKVIDEEVLRLKVLKEEEGRKAAVRLAEIDTNCQKLKDFPAKALGKHSSVVAEDLNTLKNFTPNAESFGERVAEAEMLKNVAIDQLKAIYDTASAQEAQAAKLAAQEKEIEEERRVAKIQKALHDLMNFILEGAKADSDGLIAIMKKVDSIDVHKFGDFKREAEERIQGVKDALKGLYEGKLLSEKAKRDNEALVDSAVKAPEKIVITPKEDIPVKEEPKIIGIDTAVEKENPVTAAAAQATKKEAANSDELAMDETFQAFIDLTDQNTASIIMEALVAGSVPHVSLDWIKNGQ